MSITALVADHMVKAADVRLLGFETTGGESLLIRIAGDVSSVEAALRAAADRAGQLGGTAVTRCVTRPAAGLEALIHFPNAQNPLYGGRDQFLSTDHPQSPFPGGFRPQSPAQGGFLPQPKDQLMSTHQQAIGILETQGLTAILEATDAMLKAANVTLVCKEKIGAAYVTVIVRGDVAAVKAAVDAGARAVEGLGKLIAAHVIARPHADLVSLLPK